MIWAAVPFDGDPWKILTERAPLKAALPLGTVLTLPRTGTECNGPSVISRRATGENESIDSARIVEIFAAAS